MPEPPVSPIPDQTLASLAEASKNVNLRLDREQQDRHLMAKLANDRAMHDNKLALEKEKDLGIQKRYEQARSDELKKQRMDAQYQNDLNAWQDQKDRQNKEYEKLVLKHNTKLKDIADQAKDAETANTLQGRREEEEAAEAERVMQEWEKKYLTRQGNLDKKTLASQRLIVHKLRDIGKNFKNGLTAWQAQHAGAAADWTAQVLRDPVAFFEGNFAAQLGYDFSELDQLTPEADKNNKAILASIGSEQLNDMVDALYSHTQITRSTGQKNTLTFDDLFADTPGAWTTDRQGNKIGEDKALDNMKEHLKAGFQAAIKGTEDFNNWVASLPEDNAYRTVLSQMIHSGATNLKGLFEGLSARPSVLEEAGLDPESESEQVEAFKTQMQDIATDYDFALGTVDRGDLKIFRAEHEFEKALESDIASSLLEVIAMDDILSTDTGIQMFIEDYETNNLGLNLLENLEKTVKDQVASWVNVLPEPEMRAEAEQFIAQNILNTSGGDIFDHFMKPLIKTLKAKSKVITHRSKMEQEKADYSWWKQYGQDQLADQLSILEKQRIALEGQEPIAPVAPPRPQREIY